VSGIYGFYQQNNRYGRKENVIEENDSRYQKDKAAKQKITAYSFK
jgi:hypothetical protein